MRFYKKDRPLISFIPICYKLLFIGLFNLLITALLLMIHSFIKVEFLLLIVKNNTIISVLIIICGFIMRLLYSEHIAIKQKVQKALYSYEYGNPLNLKDGQLLPNIKCKRINNGVYELTISAIGNNVDNILNLSSVISSSLNRKLKKYAVTQSSSDIAFNSVSFRIENVLIDNSLMITDVSELKQNDHTKLIVQNGTFIDLTTSCSILCAGKTRSGKTTAIISLLIQALQSGPDRFGSEIMIIDPKRAELSVCPHTFTINNDGEVDEIIEAMQHFSNVIVQRQKVLNELSMLKGDAVHWWDADMKVSLIFIDEYLSLRATLPKKATKERPNYSLETFDGLLKKIVTMGASAGCYAIISIAEASVNEGGLPALIRSACTTKLLFKPTIEEARLIWDNSKLNEINNGRTYNAGDCWFSSTDGINDNISFVHFPYMQFSVYAELSRLLTEYYKKEPQLNIQSEY